MTEKYHIRKILDEDSVDARERAALEYEQRVSRYACDLLRVIADEDSTALMQLSRDMQREGVFWYHVLETVDHWTNDDTQPLKPINPDDQ